MHMFRFWSSDSRGCDKIVEANHYMPEFTKPVHHIVDATASPRLLKRKRAVVDGGVALPATLQTSAPAKRVKTEPDAGQVGSVDGVSPHSPRSRPDLEQVHEIIEQEFSHEILLKHNELRLIEQELAKCQVALEQLRRCHLLPYPTQCPTPQQMLDISSGKGAAVRPRPGESLPKWASPFGVIDGPYARHYAKWLIPDAMFDGSLPEWQGPQLAVQLKSAVEGRTTRNSLVEPSFLGKHRAVRGTTGQKLHALSSGYPQPKEKAGPCVLKRSDGQTVKLVCIDCDRENFSSTQGFINHCRIAHKRDFKSHEEAAVHCGHPIEVDEVSPTVNVPAEDRPSAPLVPGFAHPLTRPGKETCDALLSRINASAQMLMEGRLTHIKSAPHVTTAAPAKKFSGTFVGSDKTPYLTKLMQSKNMGANLHEHVEEAKNALDSEDDFSPDEESEDDKQVNTPRGQTWSSTAAGVRTPAVMRVPARPTMTPATVAGGVRPTSSKGCSPHLSFALPSIPSASPIVEGSHDSSGMYDDDEMDVDLSPNPSTSNNAPSLVSDDGEYDDSDDGSSSEAGDSEPESVSDVAEINIEEDDVQGHETPRGIRHHRGSTGAAVKLKKDEAKHVTFVSPVQAKSKGRRKQNI